MGIEKMKEWKYSRPAYLKKEAERIARMMKRAGMIDVEITGSKGNWLVVSNGSTSALAKFASEEAHYEAGKWRTLNAIT